MLKVNISIKNNAQLKRWTRVAPVAVRTGLVKALNKSALYIGREAKKEVTSGPNQALDTGRLRASIIGGDFSGGSFTQTSSGFVSAKPLKLTAEVGPNVDYAIFVHEGTRFMRARPFLKTAVDNSVENIDRFFTEEVRSALVKAGKLT